MHLHQEAEATAPVVRDSRPVIPWGLVGLRTLTWRSYEIYSSYQIYGIDLAVLFAFVDTHSQHQDIRIHCIPMAPKRLTRAESRAGSLQFNLPRLDMIAQRYNPGGDSKKSDPTPPSTFLESIPPSVSSYVSGTARRKDGAPPFWARSQGNTPISAAEKQVPNIQSGGSSYIPPLRRGWSGPLSSGGVEVVRHNFLSYVNHMRIYSYYFSSVAAHRPRHSHLLPAAQSG